MWPFKKKEFDWTGDKPRIKPVLAYNDSCKAFDITWRGKKYNTELRYDRAWTRLRLTLEGLKRKPEGGVWGVWD